MELPYNLDAEKQVIANMIFSSDVLVETFSRLGADDFYDKKNQIIFQCIYELYAQNKAKVEPSSLIDRLSINGQLEEVGDASYIFELVESYIDITNAKYYISTVEERSVLRKIILYSNNVVNKWQSESSGDISNYINKVEKDLTEIIKKRRVEDFVSVNDAFARFRARISDIRSGANSAHGLYTGYNTFDNLMMGFKDGELSILAARPSVGKSALALNFLYRASLRTQKPCVFFSLEMGVEQVINRILSAASGVEMKKIQTGRFDRNEEDNINKAMRDLTSSNLFIDDTPGIKVTEIRSKLNKLRSKYGDIGLIVVDYIGLVTPDIKSKKAESRALELGQISASLLAIARDFHCPVLALSQLNRAADNAGGKNDTVPQLSNLRESGSLEQDAHVVMFIHRPDYGKPEDEKPKEEGSNENKEETSNSAVKLIIAKNRNGVSGRSIDFMFQKHIGKFIEMDVNK